MASVSSYWQAFNFGVRVLFGTMALGWGVSALGSNARARDLAASDTFLSMLQTFIVITSVVAGLKALMRMCDCDPESFENNEKAQVDKIIPGFEIESCDALSCNLDAFHLVSNFLPMLGPIVSMLRITFDEKNAGKVIAKDTKDAFLAFAADGNNLATADGVQATINSLNGCRKYYLGNCLSYSLGFVTGVGAFMVILTSAKILSGCLFTVGFALLAHTLIVGNVCDYYISKLSIFKQTLTTPSTATTAGSEMVEVVNPLSAGPGQ